MKLVLPTIVLSLALGLATLQADAAKRFGGGGNLGKQRPAPTSNQATKEAPSAAPASPAATPASPAPGVPAPKPTFMQRWGGLLAGLGIGALLASMFGANMGPIVGMLLLGLLVVAIGFMLLRLFAARGTPASRPAQFAAPGALSPDEPAPRPEVRLQPPSGSPQAAAPASSLSAAEVGPFLRVAKTSFIRLQTANDAKDLDDIRDYTTPEVFAEISMQLEERGDAPQKTEIVMLDAQLVENVVEGDYALASVRFSGLIRENGAANPEPFDEVWNVRRNLRERNASWLIAGIQQAA